MPFGCMAVACRKPYACRAHYSHCVATARLQPWTDCCNYGGGVYHLQNDHGDCTLRKDAQTKRRCDGYAFRAVKLVDALVSVLTLQNTLIIANGSAGESDMFTLSIWTSAGLYCLIVAVSVVCLVRNVRAMRAFNSEVPQCETQGVAGKNKLA